jgi:transcription initiation factor TFIID subunit 2
MQREPARRGFTVSHQKVVVELNFAGSLRGYTEITIVPVTSELKTVHLHSRQCTIHGVKIQKTDTDFVYRDPLASITASKANDVHIFPEIQRKIYSALSESDEGELSIAIPDELAPMHKANIVPLHHQFDTPEPARMGTPSSEFAPLTITIEYSLTNPLDGLQFVLPTEAYPYVSGDISST